MKYFSIAFFFSLQLEFFVKIPTEELGTVKKHSNHGVKRLGTTWSHKKFQLCAKQRFNALYSNRRHIIAIPYRNNFGDGLAFLRW